MIQARKDPQQPDFSDIDIQKIRHHGAKPTITSAAQHYGLGRRKVRQQGGWQGHREDTMPDTYLRKSTILALTLQEQCMTRIQSEGSLPVLVAENILHAEVSEPATEKTPTATQASSPLEQCDEGLDSGWLILNEEAVADDKASEGDFNVSDDLAEPAIKDSADQDNNTDSEVASASSFSESGQSSEVQPDDPEGAVSRFIFNDGTKKYHRVDPNDTQSPLCHTRGKVLKLISATAFPQWRESHESSACQLCFPVPKEAEWKHCTHICGRILADMACSERCNECHNTCLVDHDCLLHMSPSERATKRVKALHTIVDVQMDLLQGEIGNLEDTG